MYIEDGRKMLKFAVRISASYLLYAMNKLRLSAYLCTPSGNPKLCLGSVCPFCAIFPKPGGRSPLHIAQFIRLSLIIRIDGGRCVKKRGKNIFFYIADMSRVFAHAVKNIENMPVMKL